DGVFSNTTEQFANIGTTATATVPLSIPATALLGAHRMRIRYAYNATAPAMDPCADLTLGEAEDYMVTILPMVNCSGTPATPAASSTLAIVCGTASFTLNTTGASIGGGITYQWEELPQGGSWSPIANATNTSYTITGGLTVATDYRLVSSCPFGNSSTSNIVSVAPGAPTQCYCTPVYSNGCSAPSVNANARIESVTLAGAGSTAITNTNSGCSPNGYGSYLGQSVNLEQGTSYNVMMSFVANSGVTVTPYVAIWIDLDDDGVFSNTTEQFANMGVTATATVPLSIPAAALLGAHRMRIRYTFNGNPSAMDPCANLVLGETEDYMVTIVPFANCSGTPATPVASSTSAIVCGTDSFTLSVTGATNGGGVTYQWEALPQGGSWSPLANATNTSHTITGGLTVPTNYRLVSSCPFGNSSTSNIVSVAPGGPTQCYCTPVYSAGGCTVSGVDARIESVTVTGAGSTAITNTNSGCSANGYGSYLGQSVTMEQGASYNMTISFVNSVFSGTPHVAIWIDLDDDGVLSNTTEQLATVAVAATATVPLSIPATALLGTHRMRIRYTYNGNPSAMDPCADLTLGETEDYMVNVTAPLAIKLTAIHAENEGVVNNVLWSTASEDKGDYFILERSANGTDYTDITVIDANGRASSYVYKDHTAPVGRSYYRLKMSDAGGKYSYSKTASAYKKSRAGLSASLYPNPASAAINLELVASGDQEIQYEVVNIIGKVVKSGTYQVTNGMNKTKLDIASVTSGKYFIKIIGKEDAVILSFIKH
ncbi:MAG TPA: GEVED domain-containing protein, partial [Flavipsychrobacter sp.]|nr:GEVED domain-containing protein [Flavipsychrobacter sp.]